jgi:glycosyltransferase involved in cell wall biosynthesis
VKLFVQIPAWNEDANIGQVISSIPRQIEGVDKVEVLVVDDGSTDRTKEVAREAGADHLVCLPGHRGLARAFQAGIDACLRLGADIIVNTDADQQYPGSEIPALIQPLLGGQAEMVIADRGIAADSEYPVMKKGLQRLGTWVVRRLSGTAVRDATSGFRAFTREAALSLQVISEFTYTLETIISAGEKNLAISSVPVRTNPSTRESRLFESIYQYLARSAESLVRIYSRSQPLRVFGIIGALIFTSGFGIGIWFLVHYFTAGGKGHIQLLIMAAVLLIVGFQVMLIGLVADLIAGNRKLMEEILTRLKRIELSGPERGEDAQ